MTTNNKPAHTQYSYSFNEENYHGRFDDIDACIKEARWEAEDRGETGIWIGEIIQRVGADFFPDAYHIVEHMQCQAYDICEEADDYLDGISKETFALIDADIKIALSGVFEKHGIKIEPTFFGITNSRKYEFEPAAGLNDENEGE